MEHFAITDHEDGTISIRCKTTDAQLMLASIAKYYATHVSAGPNASSVRSFKKADAAANAFASIHGIQ